MAKETNTMWGGRFAGGPDAIMEEINASVGFDKRLASQDIKGSLAHVKMLAGCGIISADDAKAIASGLDTIAREIAEGSFSYSTALEDIHMNIENRLKELIGPAAGRLHTARSRNDQVAVDMRLFVRDAIDQIDEGLAAYQETLATKALIHADTVMPGYTHLQVAQPITFGHHLLAYVEMAGRDRTRFADARARLNESPLGAAALAGTSFSIDRDMTARELGFDRPMANALDAVSSRDYVIEALAAIAICATHLSRLAEEIVIWSSAEFAFARLSHKFTTGSSIMPQKRNPDAAELVRGKTGRINGALITVLTMMKGLPMAYGKDMQEDKEAFFDAYDTFALCLIAMTGMVDDIEPDKARLAEAARGGYSTATDLADWLVARLNLPFRDAHHITGAIVAAAEARGCRLDELPLTDLQSCEPRITAQVFSVLTVENAVQSRNSHGGTAPDEVRRVAKSWLKRLETAGQAR